uniref:Uncharacterized protein n=1 Tax=Glossina pallidipes TaxID=7398 RepID=A0A1A9Z5L1_GLOPL
MYTEHLTSPSIVCKVLLMIDNTSHDVRPDKRLLPIISIDGNLSIDILRTVNEAVLLMQPVTEDRKYLHKTAYFAVRGGRVDVTVALLVLKRILLEPFCNIKLCVNCMPDCCKFARIVRPGNINSWRLPSGCCTIVFEPHVVLLAASRVLLDDISFENNLVFTIKNNPVVIPGTNALSAAVLFLLHEVSELPDYCITKYSCNNCGMCIIVTNFNNAMERRIILKAEFLKIKLTSLLRVVQSLELSILDNVRNIDVPYLRGLAVLLGLVLLFGAPIDKRDVNFDDSAEIAAAALKFLPFILGLREDFVLNSDVDLIISNIFLS